MKEETKLKIEAAAFRGLIKHLQERTDVQNIDLMNLAGFCRNCLSKWYKEASEHYGSPVDYENARIIIYGMPYNKWKEEYQKDSTQEQRQEFESSKNLHAKISVIE